MRSVFAVSRDSPETGIGLLFLRVSFGLSLFLKHGVDLRRKLEPLKDVRNVRGEGVNVAEQVCLQRWSGLQRWTSCPSQRCCKSWPQKRAGGRDQG